MATYITGRDLTLTINSVNYDAQASTVTLTTELNQAVLEVLSGRAYKTIDLRARRQLPAVPAGRYPVSTP